MSNLSPIRVLAWSEWTEPNDPYPAGIHGAVAEFLNRVEGITATTSQLSDPEQGLPEKALAEADVLVWFGHLKHGLVSDEHAQRVVRRVKDEGMGFVPLHSSHKSKPLNALWGTTGNIGSWREDDMPEYLTVKAPEHPIAEGIRDFVIPKTEMYSEPFDIPEPETLVFHSRWDAGEEIRSGCTWTIGKGRIFYFRPGHETLPIFFQPEVQRIVTNAVRWVARRT